MLNNFIKAYQIYIQQFEHNLETSLIDPDSESIHQLRVAVKKQKALTGFFDSQYKKDIQKRNHLHFHRKIFKAAADVRNIDIFTELSTQYASAEIETEFLKKSLVKIREKQITMFYKSIYKFKNKAYKSSNEFYKSLKKINDSEFRKITFDYLKEKVSTLNLLSQDADKENEFHTIRTKLKTLCVLISAYDIQELSNLLYELKITGQILGYRHDKFEFYVFLQKFKKKRDSSSKKLMCEKIQNEILSDLKDEKSSLKKNLSVQIEGLQKTINQYAQN